MPPFLGVNSIEPVHAGLAVAYGAAALLSLFAAVASLLRDRPRAVRREIVTACVSDCAGA